MKIYSNYDMHRLRDTILSLFKQKHFSEYDAELQAMICTIVCFVADYERRTGTKLDFQLEERLQAVPVDDL